MFWIDTADIFVNRRLYLDIYVYDAEMIGIVDWFRIKNSNLFYKGFSLN